MNYRTTNDFRAFFLWNALVHLSVGKVRSKSRQVRFRFFGLRASLMRRVLEQTFYDQSMGSDYDVQGTLVSRGLTRFANVAIGHNIGRMFAVLLLILIGASLLPSVANATTGITIAHTGFTPNANVTATPGFVALIQVLPLVFIGVVLGFAIDELAAVL